MQQCVADDWQSLWVESPRWSLQELPRWCSSTATVSSIEKVPTVKRLRWRLQRLCYTWLSSTTGDFSASRSNIAVDWSGLLCALEPERPACHSSSGSCANGTERGETPASDLWAHTHQPHGAAPLLLNWQTAVTLSRLRWWRYLQLVLVLDYEWLC